VASIPLHLAAQPVEGTADLAARDSPSSSGGDAELNRSGQIAEHLDRAADAIDQTAEQLHKVTQRALRALADRDQQRVERPAQALKVTREVVGERGGLFAARSPRR
jgi:hypothetical protein